MSSTSDYSASSDIEDMEEYEMIMQINEDQEDEVHSQRRYICRDREIAEKRLIEDYFGPYPKYTAEVFRKRYRMSRKLFLQIVQGIETYCATVNPLPKHFHFFTIRYDATGMKSMSVIMKCTSALRQLANSTVADALDEYLQVGEHCARDCLDFFCMCVIDLYKPEFLRKPTPADIKNIYAAHNTIHGFPRMLSSLDCMHWEWVNCPKGWHRRYGRGVNNDIIVLHHSLLFDDLLADNEPVAPYLVNGQERGYYLTDGIYPQWSCFVKSFSQAREEKTVVFKRRQESARKDIERAFGVLQG